MVFIIIFCALLLIAYLFDLTFSKTKIPSVILLLTLGFLVKQSMNYFNIFIPDISAVLPIFGTIGLILIVLEGSLELEVDKSKGSLILKSLLGAILPLFALASIITFLFYYVGNNSLKLSLLNAIPLCIISSAIAIPSVANLNKYNKEFIIYESSISDIIGVIFFNFIAFNTVFNGLSFANFGIQIVLILAISLIAIVLLSFLLNKIDHHIKFVPIILLVILLYSVLKMYHLPALIFILLFGLFLGNLERLKSYAFIDRFKPNELQKEVAKFKELTIEATFLIRSMFFLLFGFLLKPEEILEPNTLVWAIGIVAFALLLRVIQLMLSNLPIKPLLFVAPRGLITILLFLSLTSTDKIDLVNKSLITQIIIISALVMMFGLMTSSTPEEENEVDNKSPNSAETEEALPDRNELTQENDNDLIAP